MPLSTNQVRVIDPILTTVVQGYKHPERVGHHLFPGVPVQISGGQVMEFGKESFKLYNARRAPGGTTKRIQFGYLGKPFSLVQDSLEAPVPREFVRDASVPGINLGSRAVNTVMQSLTLTLENDQAALAINAANYDASHKVALAGTAKWSDPAGKPMTDIDAGREAIRSTVGIYPNVLLLSATAFNALKNNPSITDRFKYTNAGAITEDMLARLLSVAKVVVGSAISFNDAGVSTDIWGNNAVLAYVPASPSGMEEPSYGYTYTMEGNPLVEVPYYDNTNKSWVYGVNYERVPVLSGITSGYLIQTPA